MQNQSVDEGDAIYFRAVDNSIILMALLIARLQLDRAKFPKIIKDKLDDRIQTLIRRYEDPHT